jgi:hypothetical protein
MLQMLHITKIEGKNAAGTLLIGTFASLRLYDVFC